nr:peptide-methionine (R)-S-oxide reductase MsrB [Liberibacter crescens]
MVEKMTFSDKEWKSKLTKQQYAILRQEGTEYPFTSPLLDEHRDGTFICAGCGFPLFLSTQKFDSGTGWPSFFDVIPKHVEISMDYKIGVARKEYHCARCGGHQGHVFEDGPQPTGLRYCNNGAVLTFIPKRS